MATKSDISKQTFEKLLEEQKAQEILKWGELEEGEIMQLLTTSSLILGMENRVSVH